MKGAINVLYFWSTLKAEVADIDCTMEQRLAVNYLERTIQDAPVPNLHFVELGVKMVEDILVIYIAGLADDMQPIINGKWLQIAIEDDGYMVLTGSDIKVPVTGVLPGA